MIFTFLLCSVFARVFRILTVNSLYDIQGFFFTSFVMCVAKNVSLIKFFFPLIYAQVS